MFRVIFSYDEATCKWDVQVEGTTDKVEARQGFAAVVLTCQQVNPNLLSLVKVGDDFKLSIPQ